MKDTLSYPSWDELEKGTLKLAINIANSNYKPDYIVGLSRGGLVPAIVLSHTLNVPLVPVSFSSMKGNGDNKDHTNDLPIIRGEYFPPKLLIVDDICDSGHTLLDLYESYTKSGHSVRTVALYFKQHNDLDKQIFNPDFYWQTITDNSPWICFPWEV